MAVGYPLATVRHGTLVARQDGRDWSCPVGSPAWYAWLAEATTFAFVSEAGTFTAR